MQGKQHSEKQSGMSSPQHVLSHSGLKQDIEHQPVAAHAYQRVSSNGQSRTHSSTDILTLQRAIGNQAVQRLLTRTTQRETEAIQRKENNTGLPGSLKSGIENLSGLSLDDVRVHYNSSKPAQLQALAYTQGTEIHMGPGQEQHLAHEAWHVVQQMQGRVKPTLQMKGVEINDDVGLEREADGMGSKAMQNTSLLLARTVASQIPSLTSIQMEYRNNWENVGLLSSLSARPATIPRMADAQPPVQKAGGRSVNPTPDATKLANHSEHHVIPHSKLLDFYDLVKNKLGAEKATPLKAVALPDWSSVTIAQLVATNDLSDKLPWRDAGLSALEAETVLISAENVRLRLEKVTDKSYNIGQLVQNRTLEAEVQSGITWQKLNLADKSVDDVEHYYTEIKRGKNFCGAIELVKNKWQDIKKAEGQDIDLDLADPYYEWFPGNLFSGPEGAIRADDPGDSFDTEASYFLPQEHYKALEGANELIDRALSSNEQKDIEEARKKLRATFLQYRTRMNWNEIQEKWGQYQTGAKEGKWAPKTKIEGSPT